MELAYLVGLGFSIATLIFAALGLRGRSRKDYEDSIRAEAASLRARLEECEREQRRLRSENQQWLREWLMRKKRDEHDPYWNSEEP